MLDHDDSPPTTSALTPGPLARHPMLRIPHEAWAEALSVRSYEVGRDGSARPGVILRYLESLATHASASLGFSNRWYREHRGAWVVREMSLVLGAPVAIDDDLLLRTWVSDFRQVQSHRDYLITRADSGRLVARARGRWAYIDPLSGRPARIPEAITTRMGPWGHGMDERGPWAPHEQSRPIASIPLVAREYEADGQGHINNCVYLDWFDEAARHAIARPARPRYFRLEYNRQARPGDALTIHSRLAVTRSRGLGLWQWITEDASGASIAVAWSEWITASGASSSSGRDV